MSAFKICWLPSGMQEAKSQRSMLRLSTVGYLPFALDLLLLHQCTFYLSLQPAPCSHNPRRANPPEFCVNTCLLSICQLDTVNIKLPISNAPHLCTTLASTRQPE